LYEEVAQPFIELLFRKGAFVYDKVDGKLKIKKLTKAKDNKDEKDYLTTIGSV